MTDKTKYEPSDSEIYYEATSRMPSGPGNYSFAGFRDKLAQAREDLIRRGPPKASKPVKAAKREKQNGRVINTPVDLKDLVLPENLAAWEEAQKNPGMIRNISTELSPEIIPVDTSNYALNWGALALSEAKYLDNVPGMKEARKEQKYLVDEVKAVDFRSKIVVPLGPDMRLKKGEE